MQLEFEKRAVEERVKRAEVYDATLEERAREQATQLADARDKESQYRATAAQMRFCTFTLSVVSNSSSVLRIIVLYPNLYALLDKVYFLTFVDLEVVLLLSPL